MTRRELRRVTRGPRAMRLRIAASAVIWMLLLLAVLAG